MEPPSRTLAGTNITTSALGLGCAGLHRLPHRADREAVMVAAVTAGVRHFDTAPMYGLGRSEPELATILRRHRGELTVTTKFGIDPSRFGRAVGRVQGPARALLAYRADLQHKATASGAGPTSGAVGRLLYAATGYDAATASRSLHRSLRALRTDCIDIFALHDPIGTLAVDVPELAAYLDDQVRAGTIRCWGIAGALPPRGPAANELVAAAPLIQRHDDVFEVPTPSATDKATITFGCLSRALPALMTFLAHTPGAGGRWSERFGADVRNGEVLARLLLREAIRRNDRGVVLFNTTRPRRVTAAVSALVGPDNPAECLALRAMVAEAAANHSSQEGPT